MQSDWRTLWLDSGDPETAQEFTRLFAGPVDPRLDAPAALLRDAGLRVVEDGVDTIRGERLAPGAYATELLRLLREFLVVQGAGRAGAPLRCRPPRSQGRQSRTSVACSACWSCAGVT